MVLSIVHHPDRALLGLRGVLAPGRPVVLGRADQVFMPGVFDGGKTSREHTGVTATGRHVAVSDLGSRNGTWVNGARIERASLSAGDVLGLGSVLLLVHEGPLAFKVPQNRRLLGVSHALSQLLEQIALVAGRDTSTLILGETGVGKELVARELHARSGRRGAFVPVNCGALSEGVMHSELFGHVRGAYSGASTARAGLVEEADAGTLFLDEVGDATQTLQTSLLRLLENREYRRVGANRIETTNARFVAATHPRVEEAMASGGFREDLWTRLARWVVRVPPLRDRPEDIPHLFRAFADRYAGRPVEPTRALSLALVRHRWPHNVRELQAFSERVVTACQDADVLDPPEWLAAELAPAAERPRAAPAVARAPVPERVVRPPRAVLESLCQRHRGNVSGMAAELSVPRKTLYRWLAHHGLDVATYR